MEKDYKTKLSKEVKENNPEPTNWSIYECILGISKRIFTLEKLIKIIIFISLLNLLLMILMLL